MSKRARETVHDSNRARGLVLGDKNVKKTRPERSPFVA